MGAVTQPAAAPGRWRQLGPGLLFAASAIGVSHLVQCTRAGASYGLAMLVIILAANAAKYPAFRYGAAYTADTGFSLVESFRRQGRWALGVFTAVFFVAVFISQAAVTLVTAGLLKAGAGVSMPASELSVLILVVTAVILAVGRYHLLDIIIKVLMAALFVATVLAAILAVPFVDFSGTPWLPADLTLPTVMFIAALAGWMPAPLDAAVMQSMWTAAKAGDQHRRIGAAEARFDFHVGYLGTVLLAVCFMVLGAGIMHGADEQFADSAGGFAAQVIALYTRTLGDWSWPLIATAAFATMYSTVLTAMDGFARIMPAVVLRWRSAEVAGQNDVSGRPYLLSLLTLTIGGGIVVTQLLDSFRLLVTVATTLSFLTAPFIAWLIHRAITSPEVSVQVRPSGIMHAWSLAGVGVLLAFAVTYAVLRLLT